MNGQQGCLADSDQIQAKIGLKRRVYGVWKDVLAMIGLARLRHRAITIAAIRLLPVQKS